jgi:hypothetical protein
MVLTPHTPHIHSFSLITGSTQTNRRCLSPSSLAPRSFTHRPTSSLPATTNLKLESKVRSERVRQGESARASQGRWKRRRRTQSQAPSHPESAGSSLAPSTTIARCVLRTHKVCNGGIGLDVEVQEVCRVASAWGTSRSRDLRPPGEEQRCSDLYLVECSHR